MKRVAVITDIHANLPALEATLAEIAAYRDDGTADGGGQGAAGLTGYPVGTTRLRLRRSDQEGVTREAGSSINGSIPDAYAASCKSIRKEKPRERGFCRAL
jgi:hypothetical protein